VVNEPARSPSAPAETFPLSALNHLLYCERRAYLIHAEGVFVDNEHTVLGNLAHEHVDFAGYEQRAGWTLLRALPLFSDHLGLTGKADLVEVRYADDTSAQPIIPAGRFPIQPPRPIITAARPVEYKKGPKRRWDNDEVQLCAQALCLEEMFGLSVETGAIFHASSQTRREIVFDSALRHKTLFALAAFKSLIAASRIPPAILKPQCDGCSLRAICLPEASAHRAGSLFAPRRYS
jgi:CRISPR-associated exonuclease Cas4